MERNPEEIMEVECSTCLESFTSKCDISTTPCGHVFHTDCITRWLNNNSNCSQCRKPCRILQIIKLYFSESQSALDENITLNDLEQKSLKLEDTSQKFERELSAMKTLVLDKSIEITQTNQKCKKLEHEKMLMKRDWSKTEWNLKGLLNDANKQIKDIEKEFNDQKMIKLEMSKIACNLKGSLNNANKQIKDLEKEVNQAYGKIKDLEKKCNDRRKEFNDQKLLKLESERNLKKSINEANEKIKELEKEVIDIKQSTKIMLDLKAGQTEEQGLKRPCITLCKPRYSDKDLDDQNMVDKTKSGLESKAGGAVKRKRKDNPINIKNEEENIGNVIVDIFDIFYATLARLRHGIKSANVLYTNCKDLWEYLTLLSTLPSNANYEAHTLKLDTWLTLLQSMNINHELTDNQVREMNIDFYNASNALKKFQNSKSKEKQHGC